jgi:GPH family glycoside/pentoside/hexuronide:cation symporter
MHMPNATVQPETYTAPRRDIWLWALGGLSDSMMIMAFGLIMQFYNTGFGIDSRVLGWALMIPRLIDAILDPILGHYSDGLRTRWGRRKPFLAVCSVLGAMLVAGIWWADPAWHHYTQFAYLAICATLYYVVSGTYSMTHQALGFELTDDYNVRARVAAIRTIFTQIIILGVAWTYWLALRPMFGGPINGIRVISAMMAVIVLAFGLLPVVACKERFATHNRTHVPLWASIRQALRIREFRIFIAMRFLTEFGLVVFSQLSFYINVYHVCGGNKELATYIQGIGMALSVLGTIAMLSLVPGISRRVGKRNSVIIGNAVSVLQACLVPLLLTPAYPYLQLVMAALLAPLTAISRVLRDSMVPDICDIDELANNQRREALFSAVITFIYKLEVSLCVVLVGYMISFSGFNAGSIVQPPEVLRRLQWFAYSVNIGFALMALIVSLRFPLTVVQMNAIRTQLNDRRTRGTTDVDRDSARDGDVPPGDCSPRAADVKAPSLAANI